MIRGTINGTRVTPNKEKRVAGSIAAYEGIVGASIEHVLAGATEAAAVSVERRESVTLAAFQSSTPSNSFNGSYDG